MSSLSPVVFSHTKDDWRTPRKLFDELHVEFGFTVDGAADESNHLLPRWWGPRSREVSDALHTSWRGEIVWCNPPYSMGAQFVEKAAAERNSTSFSVLLLPSRTDTRWWHDYVWDRRKHTWYDGVQGRFIKGRIKFEAPGRVLNSAPFPSVLLVFGL